MKKNEFYVRLDDRQVELLNAFMARHKLRKPVDAVRRMIDGAAVDATSRFSSVKFEELAERVAVLEKTLASVEFKAVNAYDALTNKDHGQLRSMKDLKVIVKGKAAEDKEPAVVGLVDRVAVLEAALAEKGGAE